MSTQTSAPTAQPISIHIPHTLRCYATPLHSFLARNPGYHRVVCSAFIFAPPTASQSNLSATDSRLLLVKRSAAEVSFPNLWEIPGGSVAEEDPTILHSLAREVFEETGLRLTRVIRQAGEGIEWTDNRNGKERKWLKLTFEIEVVEIGSSITTVDGGNVERYFESIPVELDPEEHQEYAWATEKEIREFLDEGKGREIGWKELAGQMLKAFEVGRMSKEEAMLEDETMRKY
ncbi:MAG: hypothetical protein LQ343_007933 [Gyalolechia ehrenbergii]|nr:MAG: hypothetical protein LQ343_007933 [Gyalolechia ehrenbergii]